MGCIDLEILKTFTNKNWVVVWPSTPIVKSDTKKDGRRRNHISPDITASNKWG